MSVIKKCISSLPVTFIYRYIFIPIFFLFISAGLWIAVSDPNATLKDYMFLIIVLILPIVLAILFLIKLKIIYVDSEGIYYRENFIKWKDVINMKFYFISPPLMVIKFLNENTKTRSIWCILPLSKYKKVKALILSLKHG